MANLREWFGSGRSGTRISAPVRLIFFTSPSIGPRAVSMLTGHKPSILEYSRFSSFRSPLVLLLGSFYLGPLSGSSLPMLFKISILREVRTHHVSMQTRCHKAESPNWAGRPIGANSKAPARTPYQDVCPSRANLTTSNVDTTTKKRGFSGGSYGKKSIREKKPRTTMRTRIMPKLESTASVILGFFIWCLNG